MVRNASLRNKKEDPLKTITALLMDKKNGHVVKQLKELLLNGNHALGDRGDTLTQVDPAKEKAPKKKNSTQAHNHPRKGDVLKVSPLRRQKDINAVKRLLASNARNHALFTVGINSALRGSDLARLKVGDVRYLEVGEHFVLREKKQSKLRNVTINRVMYDAIHNLLAEKPGASDDDYLFPSQKSKGPLTTSTLNNMVKEWCRMAKIKGKYGSHSLRKTWGYHARVTFGMDLATLVDCFGHSTQKQTLTYLGIQKEEVRKAFLNEL
jgi:integrase